ADFSRQFVIRKIEGKNFGMYASIATPGYKPETALAEISTVDFDNMLNQASRFSVKSLRAITMLAIAERCLKAGSPSSPPQDRDKTYLELASRHSRVINAHR
ncbi:MAG TPA: hypothetical protein VIT19_06775, partial [Pyrinomonadaceae bacterium]